MEMEEASLKAKKETWQVESGLAESTAKLKVLEEYEVSSQTSQVDVRKIS